MGQKITQYPNNVSVTPDELSLLDLSEKTGLATYESRKWTLTQFVAWLNSKITIPSIDGLQGQIPLFVQDDVIGANTRFTFIDNEGTEVGFRFSDSANNLTQVGVSYLNVETEGLASNSVLRLANWADNTNSGVISFRKARGTKASPTQVLANDVIGRMIGAGQHDNSGGTTTFEALVVAKENYVTDFIGSYPEIFRYALTEFQLLLAGSSDNSFFNPPFPNNLVFSVDGDGLVKFKNYQFPIADGTANQVLKTNGLGQLSWANQSGGITGSGNPNEIAFFNNLTQITSDSKLKKSTDPDNMGIIINNLSSTATKSESSFGGQSGIYHGSNSFANSYLTSYSNSFYPIFTFDRYRGSIGSATDYQDGDIVGVLRFGSADAITGIAREDRSTGYGMDVVLKSGAIGASFNHEVIRLLASNGKLRVGNAYELPKVDGTSGQTLQTDGAGNLSWVSGGGGGGSQFIPHLQGNETFRGVTHRSGVVTTDASGGYTINISGAQLARTLLTTNYLTRQVVSSYSPTATATGAYGCIRGGSALFSISGGFYFTCDYGIADSGYAVGTHNFVGLTSDLTTLSIGSSLNNQPSALTNIIAMASDSGDANMQIMHNDISGVATKIDLGSSFPSNRTAGTALTTLYVVEFYNAPATTSVKYRVTNKESGAVATGTLTTNLPSTSNTLTFQVGRSMGTSAGGVNGSAVYCVGKVGFFNI